MNLLLYQVRNKYNVIVNSIKGNKSDTVPDGGTFASTVLSLPNFCDGRPNCFMDKNYLVVQFSKMPNNRTVFGTLSVHPLTDNKSVELRRVALFDVENADQFQYQDGRLVSASKQGEIK